MVEDLLTGIAGGPWALVLLFALVLGDAFLVVVPGEAAVTAFGALSVSGGEPPLAAVIAVASIAAALGDATCYVIGRTIGLERWRWMHAARVRAAFSWARARLERRAALVLFTARFVPFARLAVNLTAGATKVGAPRYLAIAALAAFAWALYQALIGAVVATLVPGGPVVAVVVSVALALGIGLGIDALLARRMPARSEARRATRSRTGITTDRMGRMHDDSATGYDPGFLKHAVPLPRPLGDSEIRELPYPHFTVLLDPVRRLAAVTAVNIDGAALHDLPRTGEWRFDDRAPERDQAGPELYASNDLDRGHLVRRRDPGWGTVAEARLAMEATFFYTNAAPQASSFNQSKELWLGLEDHVLAYAGATAQRISVFTAPVLAGDDPEYRGILVPRRFFKVVAWTGEDPARMPRLEASGFVLDQSDLLDLREGALAVPRLAEFRTFQVPIADIEHLAGVDLTPLAEADVLPRASARGETAWRPLRSRDDVFLG